MKIILLYVSISVLVIFGGCKDKKPQPPEEQEKFRTVLVYLAANNTLYEEADLNMDQMEEAIGEVDGNLIVYAKLRFGGSPKLYHISKTEGRKEIKTYGAHNSSDPAVMTQVIQDTKTLYPAKTYGLVLWSHATGWVPPDVRQPKLKSWGDDNGSHMDVKDLNTAITGYYDFIMFDACSMASVEVLYEIKDRAKRFIVSPGEVISNGMPYDKIINDLFSDKADSYTDVARKYYEHYNSMTGLYRSATISIIDASKLDILAQETRQTIVLQAPQYADYNRDQIQRMDFDREPGGNPLIAFDFGDFMEQNYSNSLRYVTLANAITDAVIYQANTPEFNGFAIDKHSGLTCYIPHEDNEQRVHAYYRTLKWYTASGFDRFL
ncbi:MAG TPA: clostripain-related cysteine peptidase [Sphingobacterium sp.]|nr:clostripain-related cysteine peptidase [Sphingobacterium sp.]